MIRWVILLSRKLSSRFGDNHCINCGPQLCPFV